MRTIWKYPLGIGQQEIEMPENARVLCVQVQNGEPCMWALVDPNPEGITEIRTFRVYGTGHPIEDDMRVENYIGTFQLADGRFIGHLFEVVKK